MKKLLLPLAIGSALSLVGCGSGDEAPITENEVNVAATRVVFDPSNGEIPAPTNILLSGSVDGTLNIPVADPSDTANPQVAINGLDGWGTHSTLAFNFSLPVDQNGEQVSVDPASVEAQGAVRVFKTVQGGTPVSEGCAAANPAAVCAVTEELQHGTDFAVKATGEGSLAVVPLRPLESATGYLVVLTDNIQDSLGRRVKASQTYTLMKEPVSEAPASDDPSAQSLQALINSYEGALAQFGVDPEDVIYSSNFTTQSVGDVLGMTKTLLGQQINAGTPPVMQAASQGKTLDMVLSDAGITDPTTLAVASAAKVYGGKVELPYYSPLPSAENPMAPVTGRWMAKCDSPVSIVGGIASGAIPEGALGLGLTQDAIAADKAGVIKMLVQACIQQPNGIDLSGVDEERHLTQYNPVPAVQGTKEIEAFITIPDLNTANGVRAQQGLPALSAPTNGWPVVIFQHGITGSKDNAAAIAGTLAVAGYATVAIDHPLHGSRGFDVDNDGTFDITATGTENATTYMNLSSLLTTRDNLRQSIADLIGLRVSLNNFMAADAQINGQDVHFIGHSLGAIAGTGFTALANTSFGEGNPLAAMDGLFSVQASSLGMPGGSLANFLLASDGFGPTIKATLLYSANESFKAAADQAMASGVSLEEFYAGFMAQASDAEKAQINATFEQFAFAAQTVVDSGDPVNYARGVVASETPVLMIEAVGDGVIPNAVENKPLAGTEPLAALLGLEGISTTTTSTDGAPVTGIVRFGGDAEHGSLVDAGPSAAVTAEMQQQIAFWFASDMMQITISNPDLVQ